MSLIFITFKLHTINKKSFLKQSLFYSMILLYGKRIDLLYFFTKDEC